MSDTDDDGYQDRITDAVLSNSAYDRVRALRASPFRGSMQTTLTRLAALLAVLSLVLPVYAAFPPSTKQYLPTTDPLQASPKVLMLGVYGAAMITVAAAVLVLAMVTRIRRAPLDEDGASWLVDMETFAAYVGYGLGGASVAITLGYFVLGLVGAVGGYVDLMGGLNPFAQAKIAVPIAYVAGTAFSLAVVILGIQWYLTVRLHLVKQELG